MNLLCKTKALAFCFETIPSATIGVIEPLRYLAKKNQLEFVYKKSAEVSDEDIKNADIIICIRASEEKELTLVDKALALRKYLIYYLDDDLININSLYLYNQTYFERAEVKKNISEIMSKCNLLWTTNISIKNRYKDLINDAMITDAPALLFSGKHNIKKADASAITIGFAGGIDHKEFFESLLCKALYTVNKLYKGLVRFEVLGFVPDGMLKVPISANPYIYDYAEYINYMLTRKWDIGLAPLIDTSFHSCKYFNKFLEYSSIGAAGIYSRVMPFTEIVKHNENGILVNNTQIAWKNALIRLIEDDLLRKHIAENAFKCLGKRFTLEEIADAISANWHKLKLI